MRTGVEGELANRLEAMIERVGDYNPGSRGDRLREAYRFADESHGDQARRSGEPYITHLLAVAEIMAELRLDDDTLVAALLHDVVEDTPVELDEVAERFGSEVAHMVDGVTKISSLRVVNPEADLAAGRGEGVLIGGAAEFFQHKFGSGELVAKMYLLTFPKRCEIRQRDPTFGCVVHGLCV